MSSIEDFTAAIQLALDQIDEAKNAVAAAITVGESTVGTLQGASAYGRASITEGARSGLANVLGELVNAHTNTATHYGSALSAQELLGAGPTVAVRPPGSVVEIPAQRSGPVRRQPTAELRPPNSRHFIGRISASRRTKGRNTVVMSSVDVDADLAAINRGEGSWDPAGNGWEVNGRRYGVKPDGVSFPMSGPGVVELDRGEYRALQGVMDAGGDMTKVDVKLTRDPSITTAMWDKALSLHREHRSTVQRTEIHGI